MIAAYIRVSTDQQDHAAQKRAIEQAARARGDEITHWFAEKIGGHKLDRIELTKLRAGVRRGEHRKLYVFALDRLSRAGIRDVFFLVKELKAHGCTLASVSDPFDLDGPAGDVVLAVIAWGAEFELRRLRDRMRAAQANVVATGGRWGRPRRIDPGTLEKALGMRAEKMTIRQISAALKIPRSTLALALSRKGHYAVPIPQGQK